MKNNELRLQEKGFFNEVYKNQTILLKLSGAEIANQNFKTLVKDVKALIADQTKFILVFGGGNQIDNEWKSKGHLDDRPKKDGVAITTPEVMNDAVLSAYTAIQNILKKDFEHIDQVSFISPYDVKAQIKDYEKMGLTGEPTNIPIDFDKKLQVIGFVGATEKGEKLNINADEIVSKIVEENYDKIIEVIFVTTTGGVEDIDGNIVSTISDTKLPSIIAGEEEKIVAVGGMKKKLIEAKKILKHINKVAITNIDGIYDEITKVQGSGTLLFGLDNAELEPLQKGSIFDIEYQLNVESGNWCSRSPKDYEVCKKNHFTLNINKSPLGGFSLTEKPFLLDLTTTGLSFECWWSDTKQNGVGINLLEKAINMAKKANMPLSLYTKKDLSKYAEAFGLTKHGSIKSYSGATFWTTKKFF